MSKAAIHHRGRLPLLGPAPRGRFLLSAALTWLVYGAACAFWHYLSSGSWFSLSASAYVADIIHPLALAEVFEHPINALTYPWIVAIGGLLLAVMWFVPVITAVLYRLEVAASLIVLAVLLAHAPAMACALAVGCILAAKTGLRSNVSYLAALLGLAPMLPYLYLFAFGGSSSGILLPIQRWIIKAPFALALLVAIAACASVLGLARLTKYKPGVVWPVAGALVGAAIAIFCTTIGPAELDYQLIARQLAGPDTIFEPRDRRSWIDQTQAQGLSDETLVLRAKDVMESMKRDLVGKCERYMRAHPTGPRAAAVLWLEAQAMSLQVDMMAFEQGWIQATAAHLAPVEQVPGDEARTLKRTRQQLDDVEGAWARLKASGSGFHAPLADWRLGELALRRATLGQQDDEAILKQVAAAEEMLKSASNGIARVLADIAIQDRLNKSAIQPRTAHLPSKDYYRQAMLSVNRLLWLLEKNKVAQDARAARALGDYLHINPYALTREELEKKLCTLASAHEATSLGDNFKLAAALAVTDKRQRVVQLALLGNQDGLWQDTQIEAAFELGQLLVQHPELRKMDDLLRPEDYFYLVLGGPSNPWQKLAVERLSSLGAKRDLAP